MADMIFDDALDGSFVEVTSEPHTEPLPHSTQASSKNETCLCKNCGKQYKSHSTLREHISLEHYDPNKPDSRVLKCPFDGCDKQFIKKARYQDHLNLHSGLQPHICSSCNKTFGNRYKKTAHEVICSGKRVAECDQCQKQFKSQSALKVHVDAFHRNKLMRCPHCRQIFKFASSLGRHVKRKH